MIWDFWLAHDGKRHHTFFLQAPRSLGDPELRHAHATVGHAISSDLRSWEIVEDALLPGEQGEWDDGATRTGSVVRVEDGWAMLYTGVSSEDDGRVQRIGLATSPDLHVWTRHPANPVLEAPQAYEQVEMAYPGEVAWRDPWLMPDPAGQGWLALVAARVPYGSSDGRGVIASARSRDLVKWEVGPPITLPGDYGHLRHPQVVEVGGRWRLIFSVDQAEWSAAHPDRAAGPLTTGLRYLTAHDPLGPYLPGTDRALAADAIGSHDSGRIVEHDGRSWLMTAQGFSDAGEFVGVIGDPVELDLAGGQIRLVEPVEEDRALGSSADPVVSALESG